MVLPTGGNQEVHIRPDQLRNQRSSLIPTALREAALYNDVFAFNETVLAQSIQEGCASRSGRDCRIIGQKAYSTNFSGLLAARRERPNGCHAPEEPDKLTPFQLTELHPLPLD
jgi:hypothetical protein